jgi:hypothetical protein
MSRPCAWCCGLSCSFGALGEGVEVCADDPRYSAGWSRLMPVRSDDD